MSAYITHTGCKERHSAAYTLVLGWASQRQTQESPAGVPTSAGAGAGRGQIRRLRKRLLHGAAPGRQQLVDVRQQRWAAEALGERGGRARVQPGQQRLIGRAQLDRGVRAGHRLRQRRRELGRPPAAQAGQGKVLASSQWSTEVAVLPPDGLAPDPSLASCTDMQRVKKEQADKVSAVTSVLNTTPMLLSTPGDAPVHACAGSAPAGRLQACRARCLHLQERLGLFGRAAPPGALLGQDGKVQLGHERARSLSASPSARCPCTRRRRRSSRPPPWRWCARSRPPCSPGVSFCAPINSAVLLHVCAHLHGMHACMHVWQLLLAHAW